MERNTHQKQTVLNVLKSLRGRHPTADTIYEHVSQIIPTISRATVFRILNQFAEQGTIAQLHVPESADRYDDWLAPHFHLLCSSCKRVVDLTDFHFDLGKFQLPQDDVAGCRITGVELIFLGVCPECAGKQ
ncbi:MAG: transcriptional repressor [Synergistaceae bacterium]|jgi:Fe2+ or Zn2+ uptake regulation protein|nr:transcriptional repressor [Synergistaceae bacterium]